MQLFRSLARVMFGLATLVLMSACAANISADTYRSIGADLVATGHLRTDRAPLDAKFDRHDLTRNFRDIAFNYEFQFRNGRIINERLAKPLTRWTRSIRYQLLGDGITDTDRQTVQALTAELTELTGLDFIETDTAANMLISIAGPDGRDRINADLIARDLPVYARRYQTWRNTPGWVCGATLSVDQATRTRLVFAHIFIADEIDGVMRQSCLHEEIVQSLGLTNDSDRARPSIFNDDQEFALLTDHDAILLRMLYDPRLSEGMSADEAAPVIDEIARSRQSGSRLRLAAGLGLHHSDL